MDTVKMAKLRYAKATGIIIIITSVITISQFINPQVLAVLRRNPEALLAGQWWRIITPLLVRAERALAVCCFAVKFELTGLIPEISIAQKTDWTKVKAPYFKYCNTDYISRRYICIK